VQAGEEGDPGGGDRPDEELAVAPMFQNRARKAMVNPIPQRRRGIILLRVSEKPCQFPRAPRTIAP